MFLNILKNKNKIFFMILIIGIMAIYLSGCGKKKMCTTQVCVEGNCQEIEIECEDESTDIQEPMPSNQDDDKCYSEVCVEGDCQQIEIDCEPEINDTQSTQEPAKDVISDKPSLSKDKGFDYSGLLDVEQVAVNAFQAIADGDYAGLYDMYYITDKTFVSENDVKIYFQLSNYGSIYGRNPVISAVSTSQTGFYRAVTIDYKADGDEYDKSMVLVMRMYDNKWKLEETGFIGENWQFRTSRDVKVFIDGKEIQPYQVGREYLMFNIGCISKVEHQIKYTYNGKEENRLVIPFTDSGDQYFN